MALRRARYARLRPFVKAELGGSLCRAQLVADMLELHDALGGSPAIWVGHDWGSAVVWAVASHHGERCRAVANLCVSYFARGFALPNLIPLIDREVYLEDRYPVGQSDYWLYYRESFARASRVFESDVRATLAQLYRTAPRRKANLPAFTAAIRAEGGWFGGADRAPATKRDDALLTQEDFDALAEAFTTTGFDGADAWYVNDAANIAYAAEAPNFGRIALPTLFIHATNDTVCDTTQSRLAAPMRDDCVNLTEVTIDGGHEIMLERPTAVNEAISGWLTSLMHEKALLSV
jgi:pimeloyl-ACP methyl ester carboxylesterase